MSLSLLASPDGQWCAVRRGRQSAWYSLTSAASSGEPLDEPVARVELPEPSSELVLIGPPTQALTITRAGDTTALQLLQPPKMERIATLTLAGRWLAAAVTGSRAALIAEDARSCTVIRAAGRSLVAQLIDPGPGLVELVLGMERQQLAIATTKKLELWDAVAGRPLTRLQLQLPPPPRTVGSAAGHWWILRAEQQQILLLRLSDGRPFMHNIGAPIRAVVSHPASPWLVVVTPTGLLRLSCYAHSTAELDAPVAESYAIAPAGDEAVLIGASGFAQPPWVMRLSASAAATGVPRVTSSVVVATSTMGSVATVPAPSAATAGTAGAKGQAAAKTAAAATTAGASGSAGGGDATERLRAMRERAEGPAAAAPWADASADAAADHDQIDAAAGDGGAADAAAQRGASSSSLYGDDAAGGEAIEDSIDAEAAAQLDDELARAEALNAAFRAATGRDDQEARDAREARDASDEPAGARGDAGTAAARKRQASSNGAASSGGQREGDPEAEEDEIDIWGQRKRRPKTGPELQAVAAAARRSAVRTPDEADDADEADALFSNQVVSSLGGEGYDDPAIAAAMRGEPGSFDARGPGAAARDAQAAAYRGEAPSAASAASASAVAASPAAGRSPARGNPAGAEPAARSDRSVDAGHSVDAAGLRGAVGGAGAWPDGGEESAEEAVLRGAGPGADMRPDRGEATSAASADALADASADAVLAGSEGPRNAAATLDARTRGGDGLDDEREDELDAEVTAVAARSAVSRSGARSVELDEAGARGREESAEPSFDGHAVRRGGADAAVSPAVALSDPEGAPGAAAGESLIRRPAWAPGRLPAVAGNRAAPPRPGAWPPGGSPVVGGPRPPGAPPVPSGGQPWSGVAARPAGPTSLRDSSRPGAWFDSPAAALPVAPGAGAPVPPGTAPPGGAASSGRRAAWQPTAPSPHRGAGAPRPVPAWASSAAGTPAPSPSETSAGVPPGGAAASSGDPQPAPTSATVLRAKSPTLPGQPSTTKGQAPTLPGQPLPAHGPDSSSSSSASSAAASSAASSAAAAASPRATARASSSPASAAPYGGGDGDPAPGRYAGAAAASRDAFDPMDPSLGSFPSLLGQPAWPPGAMGAAGSAPGGAAAGTPPAGTEAKAAGGSMGGAPPRPVASAVAMHQLSRLAALGRGWRAELARYGAELASGSLTPVPSVTSNELAILARRLSLPEAARQASVMLYAAWLAGSPFLPMVQLAALLGDAGWQEALGTGALGALGLLRHREGFVGLRRPVADALDGRPWGAIRVAGDASASPTPIPGRLGRIGVAAWPAWHNHLGKVALVTGKLRRALVEARLAELVAVTFEPLVEYPSPWPSGTNLLVVTDTIGGLTELLPELRAPPA